MSAARLDAAFDANLRQVTHENIDELSAAIEECANENRLRVSVVRAVVTHAARMVTSEGYTATDIRSWINRRLEELSPTNSTPPETSVTVAPADIPAAGTVIEQPTLPHPADSSGAVLQLPLEWQGPYPTSVPPDTRWARLITAVPAPGQHDYAGHYLPQRLHGASVTAGALVLVANTRSIVQLYVYLPTFVWYGVPDAVTTTDSGWQRRLRRFVVEWLSYTPIERILHIAEDMLTVFTAGRDAADVPEDEREVYARSMATYSGIHANAARAIAAQQSAPQRAARTNIRLLFRRWVSAQVAANNALPASLILRQVMREIENTLPSALSRHGLTDLEGKLRSRNFRERLLNDPMIVQFMQNEDAHDPATYAWMTITGRFERTYRTDVSGLTGVAVRRMLRSALLPPPVQNISKRATRVARNIRIRSINSGETEPRNNVSDVGTDCPASQRGVP